jgi:NitT/TauT family transport system permease protein
MPVAEPAPSAPPAPTAPATAREPYGEAAPDGLLAAELAGLDALERPLLPRRSLPARLWSATWPKVAAVALGLLVWQLVVWSGWRPDYLLPPPGDVLRRLGTELGEAVTWRALATTLRRGVTGFGLAIVIGTAFGLAVSQVRVLRTALGSMITGLQTMPSIAWFPLAILLFKLSERAILFVVVIGAAPSIANGLIGGIDHIPPLWLRAGRVLGARGLRAYRHVVLPAALPEFVGGLKQGWAFAWRSLLAGELLGIISRRPALGVQLQYEREFNDVTGLMAVMAIVLIVGILADAVAFGSVERLLRRRRGLIE